MVSKCLIWSWTILELFILNPIKWYRGLIQHALSTKIVLFQWDSWWSKTHIIWINFSSRFLCFMSKTRSLPNKFFLQYLLCHKMGVKIKCAEDNLLISLTLMVGIDCGGPLFRQLFLHGKRGLEVWNFLKFS